MKVTKQKNPNRVEAGRKSYETHMLKLKNNILSSNTPISSNDNPTTSNNTPFTSSNNPINTSNWISYNAHMYSVVLSFLAIGVLCVYYIYPLTTPKIKKL